MCRAAVGSLLGSGVGPRGSFLDSVFANRRRMTQLRGVGPASRIVGIFGQQPSEDFLCVDTDLEVVPNGAADAREQVSWPIPGLDVSDKKRVFAASRHLSARRPPRAGS